MSFKSTTNKPESARSSSAKSRQSARVVSQTPIDAKLQVDFEHSAQQFDYSTSVSVSNTVSDVPSTTVSEYLQKMQRGGLIQSFGCLIAVDKKNFHILAYSENVPEMLGLTPIAVPNMEKQELLSFGTDVRTLFGSAGAAALQKAANFKEVSVLNPIVVHARISGKPFYAILHHIDEALVIDLEPVNPSNVPVTAAGALKSYKLAAKAISRLQSLSSGNISLLCDILVKEVEDLTHYDRVMVYKFHEDEHGEVIAEFCRPGLEPYLGLHYPATDIPQASRFLFMKNKVRMICDCLAQPVKVIQDKAWTQPLSLAGSTLRSPHGCHAQYMENMGSIASLVMSVMINEEGDEMENNQLKRRKLWGMVVCHHTSPRFVPFPVRYACEFLIQVFAIQINKEVELAAQMKEKHILQTQTVLCDMLLRDAPMGIITQSPNVMDLVRCDGAALYYRKNCWLLGVTPTELQVKDIVDWLLESHCGSTGLSTDSLMEAGYPDASNLGDAVCGMAAVKITSTDFLFWFRSHTAKEMKWGGAKHDPGEKDDGRKMHPRSSFMAFLEVVKSRSLPWEDVEMDAIHSLQLILRESLQHDIADESKMIVSVPEVETSIQQVNELRVVTNEMVRLIETASIPILAVDTSGYINGWNTKVAELTGLDLQEALGTPLVDLIVDDAVHTVSRTLSQALQGKEEKDIEIKLKTFGAQEKNGPITVISNACCSRDVKENIVGVCFVGQDITGQKMILDKYNRIQGDYVGIMRSSYSLIPPIFMMDELGQCVEWNDAMQKLSGLKREEAIGRMLLGEVFTVRSFGCQVKDQDTLTKLRILLNTVIAGQNADKLVFGFSDQQHRYVEVLISANSRTDSEGKIIGVLCFLHVASPELQQAMQVQKFIEQATTNTSTKLAYIRSETRNPLSGIKFIHNLMESSDLSKEQKQLLRTRILCRDQLAKIINDTDIESIEESYIEMKSDEFNLGEALDVVKHQVMILSRECQVQITYDFPSDVSLMFLYGDILRLQQVLSDFLAAALLFTSPLVGSSIHSKLILRKESVGTQMHVLHIEFWITHPAPGIPEELLQEMFSYNDNMSREGLALYISQKLVKVMDGAVQYIREADKASFVIRVEFPLATCKQQ